MITNVTVPARYCVCEICGYDWYSIAVKPPESCMNKACRSREWNGKKTKRKPEKKPTVVLPPPPKIRKGDDDEF